MDKLNSNLIDVEEAKAQANLAKQANNIKKHEMDVGIARAKYGDAFQIRDVETYD